MNRTLPREARDQKRKCNPDLSKFNVFFVICDSGKDSESSDGLKEKKLDSGTRSKRNYFDIFTDF